MWIYTMMLWRLFDFLVMLRKKKVDRFEMFLIWNQIYKSWRNSAGECKNNFIAPVFMWHSSSQLIDSYEFMFLQFKKSVADILKPGYLLHTDKELTKFCFGKFGLCQKSHTWCNKFCGISQPQNLMQCLEVSLAFGIGWYKPALTHFKNGHFFGWDLASTCPWDSIHRQFLFTLA